MTMTPHDFHDLFDTAVRDAPPSHHDDVAAGRRLLRRRRLATSAAACAAVVAVAGGGYALLDSPDASRRSGDVTGQPDQAVPGADDAALVQSCRDGQAAPAAKAALFDSGTPVVKASEVNDAVTVVALESADGSHWAECMFGGPPADAISDLRTYAAGVQGDVSAGPVTRLTRLCPEDDEKPVTMCGSFNIAWVDRLPAEVAAVRFITMGGRETVVQARDGYVVFNLSTTVPDSTTIDTMSFPLRRVVYLDAAGTPIAGEDRSTEDGTVDGLPHLSAYPSLRGAQVPEPGPS